MINQKIKNRDELPCLINELGLKGKGVEIGVQKGLYSEIILKKAGLSRFYSVDSWKHFKPSEYCDIANSPQWKQYAKYIITLIRLFRFGERSKVIRKLSEDASKLFKNESLDFVFIDALHTYEGCKKDIELWWPKLRRGGLFAGHDYFDGHSKYGLFGVKSAVDEFVKRNNLKLHLTSEKDSWFIIK